MPQFDLDDAVAEADLMVEEIMCNMIEPELIDDRGQDCEKFSQIVISDSDDVFPLEGNVQNNDDIQQVYDDACLNVQGCCCDVDLL